jgi:ferredoxin-NADP reductase
MRRTNATVVAADQLFPGCKSFLLKPDRFFPFRPGQFLHIALQEYEVSESWPDSRPFSIASSPLRKDCLRIIVKGEGTFTRKMVSTVKAGDRVCVKYAYGDFLLREDRDRILLVAGGIGITPFISFLEFLEDRDSPVSVTLHYSARLFEELVMLEYLRQYANTTRNLELFLYTTREETGNDGVGRGRIPGDRLLEFAAGGGGSCYICGPQRFVEDYKHLLSGCAQLDVFSEDWGRVLLS